MEKQLNQLRLHLLPDVFDPTGTYDEATFTKTYAYRVLVHAEIESYLEDRVIEIHSNTLASLRIGKIKKSTACLLAFSGLEMEDPPSNKNPTSNQRPNWDQKIKLEGKLNKAITTLRYNVNQNHGIKEANVLKLLIPIGIEADDINDIWLADIDSFGHERGNVAHSSGSVYRTRSLPDPLSELKRVERLLKGLKDIDEMINERIDS